MTQQIIVNNAKSTTTAQVGSTDLLITVSNASSFPTLTGTQYSLVTLDNGGVTEIVMLTAPGVTGNTLVVSSIGRGYEGTTPQIFPVGTRVEGRVTAGTLNNSPAVVSAAWMPIGTRVSFQQASAPTGWTRDTTVGMHDNAFRIVTSSNPVASASNGIYGFSAGCLVVAAHTHTYSSNTGNESASHNHIATDSGHNHTQNAHTHLANVSETPHSHPTTAGTGDNILAAGGTAAPTYSASGTTGSTSTGILVSNASVTAVNQISSANVTLGNESATHTHAVGGVTADSNNSGTWVPKYVDFLLAIKN